MLKLQLPKGRAWQPDVSLVAQRVFNQHKPNLTFPASSHRPHLCVSVYAAQWGVVSVFVACYVLLFLSLPLCIFFLPLLFLLGTCRNTVSPFIILQAPALSPRTRWLMMTVHTLKHLALFRWHTSYHTSHHGLLNAGSPWDWNQIEGYEYTRSVTFKGRLSLDVNMSFITKH